MATLKFFEDYGDHGQLEVGDQYVGFRINCNPPVCVYWLMDEGDVLPSHPGPSGWRAAVEHTLADRAVMFIEDKN